MMLTIRPEQWEVFQKIAQEKFETKAAQYLRKFWPADVEELDDDALRAMVRARAKTAAGYGVTVEADVLAYIEVTLLIGERFHEDPRYPWAGRILSDPERSGAVKTQQLRYNADQCLAAPSPEGT